MRISRLGLTSLAFVAAATLAVGAHATTLIHFDDFSTDTLTDVDTSPYNTSAGPRLRPAYQGDQPGVPLANDPSGQTITVVNGRAGLNETVGVNPSAVTLKNTVGTFDAYSTFEVSAYFHHVTGTAVTTTTAMIGLLATNDGVFQDAAAVGRSGWEVVVRETGASVADLRLRNVINGSNSPFTVSTQTASLKDDVLYKLILNVAVKDNGNYDIVSELWEYDVPTGSEARAGFYSPQLVIQHSMLDQANVHGTTGDIGVVGDTPLYAGFGIRRNTATSLGMIGADNFQVTGIVIPEPASLAMLAVGGVLLAARRRHAV